MIDNYQMPLTKEQMKEYRLKNKERIAEQQREYNRQYYQDNKEAIALAKRTNKDYIANQLDRAVKYNSKDVICKCGKMMKQSSVCKHRRICPFENSYQSKMKSPLNN